MNEDETAIAVTSKLTGQFRIGQRVRFNARGSIQVDRWHGIEGEIIRFSTNSDDVVFVTEVGQTNVYWLDPV